MLKNLSITTAQDAEAGPRGGGPVSPIAIHKTDDRLAHGVVRSALVRARDISTRVAAKMQAARTLAGFLKEAHHHHGSAIQLIDHSAKLTGSRARAVMIIPMLTHEGHYRLTMLQWQAAQPHISTNTMRIRINRHAVARFMQRTSGVGDVKAAVEELFPYALALMAQDDFEQPGGAVVKVSGPLGHLVFVVEDGDQFVAKTWINDKATPEYVVGVAA